MSIIRGAAKGLGDLVLSIDNVLKYKNFFINTVIITCFSFILYIILASSLSIYKYALLPIPISVFLISAVFTVFMLILITMMFDGFVSITKTGDLIRVDTITERFIKIFSETMVILLITIIIAFLFLVIPMVILSLIKNTSIVYFVLVATISTIFVLIILPLTYANIKDLIDKDFNFIEFVKKLEFIEKFKKFSGSLIPYIIYYTLISIMFILEMILSIMALKFQPYLSIIAWPAIVILSYFLMLLCATYVMRKAFEEEVKN